MQLYNNVCVLLCAMATAFSMLLCVFSIVCSIVIIGSPTHYWLLWKIFYHIDIIIIIIIVCVCVYCVCVCVCVCVCIIINVCVYYLLPMLTLTNYALHICLP